jgi:Holliday junction DNA helicase RuvA
MYSYFTGTLSEKTPDTVVIDTGGIAFELKIPLSTFEQLPDILETTKLFVQTIHNDEGTRLFGFFSKNEKELFKLLINVNRVGPKTALAILSTLSVKELITAIITGNTKLIAKTPGLGQKSAERLIVELKDKIEDLSDLDRENTSSSVSTSDIKPDIYIEVEAALTQLGYKNYEIRKALASISQTEAFSTGDLVKQCIKFIYHKRNET